MSLEIGLQKYSFWGKMIVKIWLCKPLDKDKLPWFNAGLIPI